MFYNIKSGIEEGTTPIVILIDSYTDREDILHAELIAYQEMLEGAKKGKELKTYIVDYNDMSCPEIMKNFKNICDKAIRILVVNRGPVNEVVSVSPIFKDTLKSLGERTIYMAHPIPYVHSDGRSVSVPIPIYEPKPGIPVYGDETRFSGQCFSQDSDPVVRKHLL